MQLHCSTRRSMFHLSKNALLLLFLVLQKITWNDPDELESYITRLQSITERLASENRRLRKCHLLLIDKVTVACVVIHVYSCM